MNPELVKLLVSVLVGALIGIEREFRDKAAGFRTLMFISLGTTVFTMLSAKYGGGDPSRIAAGLVTGIGFIGTGVIIHTRGQVVGLTTAAIVWLTASLGMCIGLGLYELVAYAFTIAMSVLWLFPFLEFKISNKRETLDLAFVFKDKSKKMGEIKNRINSRKLKILNESFEKVRDEYTYNVQIMGIKSEIVQLNKEMINDEEIIECKIIS
jgi:putative Mg2+ transporter-C (MgtC) family protein